MTKFLPAPLTMVELTALRLVASTPTPPYRGLPPAIEERLVVLGFAEMVRGGLIETDDGLRRIKLSAAENLRR
jgi:hypothetical protein